MAKLIGLTGGIASGKSTVAALLRERGHVVVDADEIAREVVAPGEPALEAIREAFGDDVMGEDGGLDRAALARVVFANPTARRTLESILHPAIAQRSGERMAEAVASGAQLVFYEAALLVETGRYDSFHALWVVSAPREAQVARAVARGLTEEEARNRIGAQMDPEERVAVADFVIDNSGGTDDLGAKVDDALATL